MPSSRITFMSFSCTALTLAFALSLFLAKPALAQNPALAPENIKYSKAVFARNHLIAQVALEIQQDKYIRFQYEQYPDSEKIVTAEGEEYSRAKGGPWMKTNAIWKNGSPVKRQKSNTLDNYAKIVYLPFADPSASGPEMQTNKPFVDVWRFIERKDLFVFDLYTYERGRATANPNAAYPLYRFMKYPNDKDGNLLLSDLAGPMADGVKVIPLSINYQLLFLPPAHRLNNAAPMLKGLKPPP